MGREWGEVGLEIGDGKGWGVWFWGRWKGKRGRRKWWRFVGVGRRGGGRWRWGKGGWWVRGKKGGGCGVGG